MKHNYRPANFKDLKEALHYIMYTGSVFFRGEEITFQHLEGIPRSFGFNGRTVVNSLELRDLKKILNQLTLREEISDIQLWKDELKNTSILCYHKYNFPVLITDVEVLFGQDFGVSSAGVKYRLEDLTPISKYEKIFASEDFITQLRGE